jgi:kynureninase
MITREDCEDLDRKDPLAHLRERFELPEGVIYLDGNSLGPPLRGVRERVNQVLDEWSQDLIAGWWDREWVDLPLRVGRRLEAILGAEAGSVICTDSTSVNLYKAVGAACILVEGDILTDRGNFPTCLYVLESVAARWGRQLLVVDPEQLEDAIHPGIGVVAATQVDYRSGRRHLLEAITRRAHLHQALMVWDLSHSAGVMEIGLGAEEVDLAVGCGYKYLNGGPGAPAYIYVSPRWQDRISNPIQGWFGHARPFDFSPQFVPASGIERMRVGTPDVISMAALERSLQIWEEVDLAAIRAKSESLVGLFIDLVAQELSGRVEVLTPLDPARRGSQVSLVLDEAGRLISDLAEVGVIADFRTPNVARFGLAPFYITHTDVFEAVAAISKLV